MRVLLPALVPLRYPTGVANYILGLTQAWAGGAEAAGELLVATNDPDAFRFRGDSGVVRVLPVSGVGWGAAGRAAALQLRIPALARRVRVDAVLCPNFLAPRWLGGTPLAVVVQDLAFVQFPSTIPRTRRMYYLAMVRASLRRAGVVFVTTRTMAAEVAEFEPTVASRIRIAPLGVSPTHLANDPDGNHRLRGGFLCVGTLEPRKNLARVLTAHGRLCRRLPETPELRIVGADGWGRDEVQEALIGHPAPGRVVRLGYRSGEQLVAEYRNACALVFCSLYEGFGLPVLEAMQHGCPVICSRGTALAEVAGGAAWLVDPRETGEIEHAMEQVAFDAVLGRRLAKAGRLRAAGFSWGECVRRTVDALAELVARKA